MEHTKHLWRAGMLLLLLPVGFVTARHFLTPKSFGLAGHYRYDSLAEYREKEPVHGGPESCKACHEEEYALRHGGKHATVSCEVCHAPVTSHAKGKEKIAEMPTRPSAKLCAYCHRKLRARPEKFPQVDFETHLTALGVAGACGRCHASHSPAPVGGGPACAKCHDNEKKEIAKGKHVSISCQVCHGPETKHVRDGKKSADMPSNASYRLCAYCHRPEAEGKRPKIDLRKHLADQGLDRSKKIPEKACAKCHPPHAPKVE